MQAVTKAALSGSILAIASLILLPWSVVAKPAGRATGNPCSKWLNKTVETMKRLPERKWRDAIIKALGEGTCPPVPEALRIASREVGRIRDVPRRDRVLADAATSVLGPKCTVPNPWEDSRSLAKVCPLPTREEFGLPESVFRDIRAVDYALIDALATSLLSSQAYDQVAQRLMLNFLLSATLLGEHRSTR